QAFLARIEQVNPSINAIHQVDPEKLLQQAKVADDAVQTKKFLGKLHGVPISIKDTCFVKGFKVGSGYPGLIQKADKDATVIQRLKQAGAIILGITNVPEFLSSYETSNRIHGTTNNPYDLTRTPGGSSGGEAALIAAGGSTLGLGSDAGGSIREPAHYCGICGHKPTQNLVSTKGGSFPIDGGNGIIHSILAIGPMARDIDDLALMLEIIAGTDELDPHVATLQFKMPKNTDLKQLKIAYYFENPKSPPCEETIATINQVISALKDFGIHSEHNFPQHVDQVYQLHWETYMLSRGETIKAVLREFQDNTPTSLIKRFVEQAENCKLNSAEVYQRLRESEIFRYQMLQWMHDNAYDILISPVTSTPARLHNTTFDHIYDYQYVYLHNLTGWPATVVPIRLTKRGLPIGIQIAAKPWHDHLCFSIAKYLQDFFGKLGIADKF
ncbi:MAG: amidase, partial [Pseudomonadota bacterium]